jgi:hypothetical protein
MIDFLIFKSIYLAYYLYVCVISSLRVLLSSVLRVECDMDVDDV